MTGTAARTAMLFGSLVGGGLLVRATLRRARHFSVSGKVVLITGASRGLGLVLARELVADGAAVAICARDAGELERARADLAQRGGDVLAVTTDVRDRRQVEELVRRVWERFGRVDVLVNNAGTITVGPLDTLTLDDYQEAMNTNFWAAVHAVEAALPELRRVRGRVVNIASIGGKLSLPHLLPYSASKFALVGFSEGLRAELLKDGVLVTTVCPGLMRTGSPRHATFKGRHRAEYAWFSLGDSLPITSMDARRAARQIIAALERGDAEVVLSVQAKLAATAHAFFPGLVTDLFGVVNRLLPGPGGIGRARAKGQESESALAPSWLTTLGDRAAARNNQLEAG